MSAAPGRPSLCPRAPRSSRSQGSQRFRVGVHDQTPVDIILGTPPPGSESLTRVVRITQNHFQGQSESLRITCPRLPCWSGGAHSMPGTEEPDPVWSEELSCNPPSASPTGPWSCSNHSWRRFHVEVDDQAPADNFCGPQPQVLESLRCAARIT